MGEDLMGWDDPEEEARNKKVQRVKQLMDSVTPTQNALLVPRNSNRSSSFRSHDSGPLIAQNFFLPSSSHQQLTTSASVTQGLSNSWNVSKSGGEHEPLMAIQSQPVSLSSSTSSHNMKILNPPPRPTDLPSQRAVNDLNVPQTPNSSASLPTGISSSEAYDTLMAESPIRWRRPTNTLLPANALQMPFRPSIWIKKGDLIDLGPPIGNEKGTPEDARLEFDPLLTPQSQSQEPIVTSSAAQPVSSPVETEIPPFSDGALISDPKNQGDSKSDSEKTSVPQSKYSIATTPVSLSDLKLIKSTSSLQEQIRNLRSNIGEKNEVDKNPVWRQILISPRIPHPMPQKNKEKSILIVVEKDHPNRRRSTPEPEQNNRITFLSALDSIVSLVLDQTLCSFADDPDIDSEEYGLKVFGKNEFLHPDSSLGTYVYVNQCISLGKDVLLQLSPLPASPEIEEKNVNSRPALSSFLPIPAEESLSVALQTLAAELGKVKKAINDESDIRSSGVIQSVKMICKMMNNVGPVELYHATISYVDACQKLSENLKTQISLATVKEEPSTKLSLDDDLVERVSKREESLLSAVHRSLGIYSISSAAEFRPAPTVITSPMTPSGEFRDVTACEEFLLIRVQTLHSILPDWATGYDKVYAACYAFHGMSEVSRRVDLPPKTVETMFYPLFNFDSWAQFEVSMCIVPRETVVCFVLYGYKVEPIPEGTNQKDGRADSMVVETQLAWAKTSVFNADGFVKQGSFLLPMILESETQPWGPENILEKNSSGPVLQIQFPKFESQLRFPEVLEGRDSRMSREFETLDIETQHSLQELIENSTRHELDDELSEDERELVWEKRHYLRKSPAALPLVLRSAVSWDWACLANTYHLVADWMPLDPVTALELLSPQFPDRRIRSLALKWITSAPIETLISLLPQIIEAARFELYENSDIAQQIIQLCMENRAFAFRCYWELEQKKWDKVRSFGFRCRMLQNEIFFWLGPAFETDILLQKKLILKLDKAAAEVKELKDSLRKRALECHMASLDADLLSSHVALPLAPGFVGTGVAVRSCSFYRSFTVPLRVHFRSQEPTQDFALLHKLGDDLRQDSLVMQMMGFMRDVWDGEGLDIPLITYKCLPTGPCKGMIEIVPRCKTLTEIQVEEGGMGGVFKNDVLRTWLQKHNQDSFRYQIAMNNFRRSCAGWCVGTYILGIGDRHNDNILITQDGHVLHIDFGKYLGDWQTMGGVRRDRVPFILTSDMAFVINEGAADPTENFHRFVDDCCQAFNLIRKNFALFINSMKLMICSGVPGLNVEAVQYIRRNLWLEYSELEATTQFTRLIEESLKSLFPRLNFLGHIFAQFRAGSIGTSAHDDPSRLSFVPQLFSSVEDGQISRVQLIGCEKWRIPEKVYMYKLRIERMGQVVPAVIFRSYKEFVELHFKLCQRFPLCKLRGLPRGTGIGRTNISDVAMRRMLQVTAFLDSLFDQAKEVAECDLVYTFFHPILRDQQEGTSAEEQRRNIQTQSVGKISGAVQLTLEYKRGRLEILVRHAKELATLPGPVTPNSYVKCYLRGNINRRPTKRKTRVRKGKNPTFNDRLMYQLDQNEMESLTLEVGVWHEESLKENVFLGGVLIPLRNVLIAENSSLSTVYPLENIPTH